MKIDGMVRRYVLGNCLRGTFEGKFTSVDEAWEKLSARFLQSFPSPTGRAVSMKVEKENEFGFNQLILCKKGVTSLAEVSADVLLAETDYSLVRQLF